jgi:hypothetical protein
MLIFVDYAAKIGLSIALLLFNMGAISLLLSHVAGVKNLATLAVDIFCGAILLTAFSALALVL